MADWLPDSDVFVLKTGLEHYSSEWRQDAVFAEGTALGQLQELARSRAGYDLFRRAIKPGDRVVIKPNLVRDRHPDGADLYAVITHPAIIRAVVDRTYRALDGEGQITIADAPMGDTDFDQLLAGTEIARIAEYYWRRHRFEIALRDLRDYRVDYHCVRYLRELSEGKWAGARPGFGPVPVGSLRVFSNHGPWEGLFETASHQSLGFVPPRRWIGHIEL